MKKLFMFLCIVIMFFGIVGCPSDDQAPGVSKSSFSSTTVTTNPETVSDSDIGANPVPEPTTLVLLGSGLVGLVGLGRKKFFKKD